MNPLSYFPEDEDPDDLLDQYIFEQVNYFTSKLPVSILFQKELDKMSKILSQYAEITGAKLKYNDKLTFDAGPISFSPEILASFDYYFELRNQILNNFRTDPDFENYATYAGNLVKLEQTFSDLWEHTEDIPTNTVISKIPDPMTIRKAIVQFNQEGGTFFSDLNNQKHDSNVELKNENYRRKALSNYGNKPI